MLEPNAEKAQIELLMKQLACLMSTINQNQNKNNGRGKFSKSMKPDSQNDKEKKGRLDGLVEYNASNVIKYGHKWK